MLFHSNSRYYTVETTTSTLLPNSVFDAKVTHVVCIHLPFGPYSTFYIAPMRQGC